MLGHLQAAWGAVQPQTTVQEADSGPRIPCRLFLALQQGRLVSLFLALQKGRLCALQKGTPCHDEASKEKGWQFSSKGKVAIPWSASRILGQGIELLHKSYGYQASLQLAPIQESAEGAGWKPPEHGRPFKVAGYFAGGQQLWQDKIQSLAAIFCVPTAWMGRKPLESPLGGEWKLAGRASCWCSGCAAETLEKGCIQRRSLGEGNFKTRWGRHPCFGQAEKEDYLSRGEGSRQKKVGAEGLRGQHGQHGLSQNDK